MNDTPTRGPIRISSTHHARDAISSRHSLPSNVTNGLTAELGERTFFSALSAFSAVSVLGERKEDLFEIVACRRRTARRRETGELWQRPFAADAAAAQQHEPIAH